MGWSIECNARPLKSFIADRCKGWTNEDHAAGTKTVVTCLTHKYVMGSPGSGRLWKVFESVRTTAKTGAFLEKHRFIALDLIKFYGGRGRTDGWGYKDLDESCGLGDPSCPLSYVDELVPDPKPHSKPACDKEAYGANACKCGGCHGCGTCWSLKWRIAVRVAAKKKQLLYRLASSLEVGNPIVIAEGYTEAGESRVITQVSGKGRGLKIVCGYTRYPLKAIDPAKTVALLTEVELA